MYNAVYLYNKIQKLYKTCLKKAKKYTYPKNMYNWCTATNVLHVTQKIKGKNYV